MEFVDSLAGLHRRAGYRSHPLDVGLAAFAREARRRFGLRPGLRAEELAREVGRHSSVPYERLAEPLLSAEQAPRDARLTESRMTELVTRLSSLHAEVFHGG
jgi:hypothetical protein